MLLFSCWKQVFGICFKLKIPKNHVQSYFLLLCLSMSFSLRLSSKEFYFGIPDNQIKILILTLQIPVDSVYNSPVCICNIWAVKYWAKNNAQPETTLKVDVISSTMVLDTLMMHKTWKFHKNQFDWSKSVTPYFNWYRKVIKSTCCSV